MVMQNFRERAITFIVNYAVKFANKKLDDPKIQEETKFTTGRIARMHITDLHRMWHFQFKDGKVKFLENPPHVDGGVDVTSDALISIVKGTRKWRNPTTGVESYEPYTPLDAVFYGEATAWGTVEANDLLMLTKNVWRDVEPELREHLKVGLSSSNLEGVVSRNGS